MKNLMNLINNLSYTETQAANILFKELGDKESIKLVMCKLTDKAGITRSTMVETLSKLAIAEVIETRSLGMAGTLVKVTDRETLEEIKKYMEI